MADWKTVRFDPNYPEPLDTEIIPLCDALNAAGFETICSCCGHGSRWPLVAFNHDSDVVVEDLARFVMARETGDFRPHFSVFQKEILPIGYLWCLEIHLNDIYSDTSPRKFLDLALVALEKVTKSISEWHKENHAAPEVPV